MGDEVTSVKCLSGINSEVVELIAGPGSAVTKKPIRDLRLPNDAVIGGIIRGNQSHIAVGSFQIQENDKVVVFSLPGANPKLEKMFHRSSFTF
jgi:trk system potassium uptake protein TrkA